MIVEAIFAVAAVALLWAFAGTLVSVRRRYPRQAIKFVTSGPLFYATISAIVCTVVLLIPIFASGDAAQNWAYATMPPVLFLLATITIHLPRAILPLAPLDRLRFPKPHLRLVEISEMVDRRSGSLTVGHATDLHLTDDATLEAELKRDSVATDVRHALSWLGKHSDLVFVTGDITDQARPTEWRQFIDILDSVGCPLESGRILIVPGNHDLSHTGSNVYQGSVSVEHDHRAQAFIMNILAKCPREWTMQTTEGPKSVREHLERVAEYLSIYAQFPTFARAGGPHFPLSVWRDEKLVSAAKVHANPVWPTSVDWMCSDFIRLAYPMIMRDDDDFLIVGLNTCDEEAGALVDSAIGRMGKAQLDRLRNIVGRAKGRCVILLMHHHVGAPKEIEESLRKRLGSLTFASLTLREARELGAILSQLEKCVVFHGHKHVGYRARLGPTFVVSGRSVSFPGGSRPPGNCSVYNIRNDGFLSDSSQSMPHVPS